MVFIVIGSFLLSFTLFMVQVHSTFWWLVGTAGLILALYGVADLTAELVVKKSRN